MYKCGLQRLASACLSGLLLLGRGGPASAADDETTEAAIEAFNTAFAEWVVNVEFRAHYTFTSGVTNSLEKAEKGEVDRADQWPDGGPRIARGVFHKKGGKLRYSMTYNGGPISVGRNRTMYNGWDESSNGDVDTVLRPATGAPRSNLFVERTSPKPRQSLQRFSAGVHSHQEVTPLSISGGIVRVPCHLNLDNVDPGRIRKSMRQLDDEHTELTFAHHEGEVWNSEKRVVMWTAPSPPVVKRISHVSWKRDRTVRVEQSGTATDFVECPGGLVAKQVVYVLRNTQKPNDYHVRKWRSEDLGKARPTDADFNLPVGEGTQVRGLAEPPPLTAKRELDLDRLKNVELSTSSPAPKPSLWYRWGVIAAEVGFAALVAAHLWRRRRRATASGTA